MSHLALIAAVIVAAAPVVAEANVPKQENLVAWYKLDGSAGKVARDSVSGAEAVVLGGTWLKGGGLAAPMLRLPANPKMSFRSGFTLAARVKLRNAAYGQVVGSEGAGGLVVSPDSIKVASWGRDWVTDCVLPEDTWVHVAVTVDTDHWGMGRIYLNGSLLASNNEFGKWPADPTRWTIGNWATGFEQLQGSVADVMVFDTCLSAEDVKSLASHFKLDRPIKIDEGSPIPPTKAVKEMAKELAPLTIEPQALANYPFHAMLGVKRTDQALRIHTHAGRAQAENWLAEQIPLFDCPDAMWKRTWYYRWFLTLVNYQAENGIPGFYEGKRGGYTRHITYSAPHIMYEVRWLKDGKYAYGQAEILAKRREPNGRRFGGYTHWIADALWQSYLVHPDVDKLADLLPAWAEDCAFAFPGRLNPNRSLRDYLLNPPNHWVTGMEWQPAWFYFDDYDTKKETNLYRPDYTAYYYANARAVASMCRETGNDDFARAFDRLADRTKAAVISRMWDPVSEYFYSIKTGTDDKAWVKEVVGIYPFAFNLPNKQQLGAFRSLLDTEEFWGAYPVRTCTKKCPMYTHEVHLCNWNGPVWPHAESLVAMAMANAVRNYGSKDVTPDKVYELLDGFTRMHYEDKGTWKKPNIHEEGDADTGEMQGCPDYFHSTYNDLIITIVGGLVPRNDETVELYPAAKVPWDHFRLDRVPYKGRMLSIVWDDREDGKRYAGVPKGYSLYVDGRLAANSAKLERMAAGL